MYIGFDFMYRKFISGVLIFLIELYFGKWKTEISSMEHLTSNYFIIKN